MKLPDSSRKSLTVPGFPKPFLIPRVFQVLSDRSNPAELKSILKCNPVGSVALRMQQYSIPKGAR